MTLRVRSLLLGTVACAVVALSAPVAYGAFGVESFFAANCKVSTCTKAANPAEEKAKAEAEGYSQAAGHPPFGITDFKLNRHQIQTTPFPAFAPDENLKNLRVDVAPGVSTNPEAVTKCSVAGFTSTEVEPVKHLFLAPNCPESSVIGENKVTTVVEVATGVFADAPLTGKVYNLEQPNGMSSYFGVALEASAGPPAVFAHTFIEGHVEWASDYHDLFEIKNITPGLLESRLIFNGNIGTGGFLTNPSNCAGPGPLTTTSWHGEAYEGGKAASSYTTPIGTEGCNGLPPFALVPFAPSFSMAPETTKSDQPDGITTELTLPHDPNPANLDSSQLDTATVTLPEGMTLNPSAAPGLEACTPAQARIHSPIAGTACPASSKIGSVTLNVPGLPPESLQGTLFLGGPETGPITGPPYTMYIDAESPRYGLSVRVQGEATTNEVTGRVTARFAKTPEQPFSDLILHFKGGALAPIANPLVCGPAITDASFTPYTGTANVSPPVGPFAVDSDGSGGACTSPLPFALSQSAAAKPTTGGVGTSFTFNLGRADGQQYLSHVSTALPLGLVGKIPAVPLCPEPQASLGTCSDESQIGTATTTVGSGKAPAQFSGPVYLTGPTGSAPYGLTTVVNAAVGPFSFGNVIVRSRIEVDPNTARVTVAGDVPTIFKGIPLRMKTLTLAINSQGYPPQPNKLWPTVDQLNAHVELRCDPSRLDALPGDQLQWLGVRSEIRCIHQRENLEGQWRVSRDERQCPEWGPGELQVGARDGAKAAAFATEHLEKCLLGSSVRRQPKLLSGQLKGGYGQDQNTGLARSAERVCLLRLPRRSSFPRSRPCAQGGWCDDHPGRQHQHQQRHNNNQLRLHAGRAVHGLRTELALGPELGRLWRSATCASSRS